MTLFQTIQLIQGVAGKQPNVNTIVASGNLMDLNKENVTLKYGAFVPQQGTHIQSGDFITYNFNLFYADRLTDDYKNKIFVQSEGIQTLQNIINGLKEIDVLDVNASNINYQTFTERFAALCAGAWCNISISSAIDWCYEEYVEALLGEFSYDFSFDFLVRK